jgi:outer membrane lipoprotein-sorting protein
MNKSGFLLAVFLSSVQLFAQAPPIDALRQELESGKVYVARMNHKMYDSFSNSTTRFSGEIVIGINAYKVTSSERSYLVYNGESKVYETNENRLLISDYDPEEDDNAPSRFLYEVDDVYEINYRTLEQGSTVELTSNDPFELYYKVTIRFDADGNPLSVKAIDQADTELLTEFEDGRFVTPEQDLWKLDLPDGVEVIDLRE